MGAVAARSGVVGQDGDGYRLVHPCRGFADGAQDAAVEVFDGLYLQRHVAFVSRLVACLYVEIDKVATVLQSVDGSAGLAFVVRVVEPCRPFDIDASQSGVCADAPDEIDGGYHRTVVYLGESLLKGLHVGLVASRPRPDAVGGIFPFGNALLIQGMIGEQLLRLDDEVVDEVGCLLRRQFGISL